MADSIWANPNAASAVLGLVPVQNNLWDQYTGDQLIVLAPNEGLVITNLTAALPGLFGST